MKKIILFGGHGFIGSNLTRALQNKYKLTLWDKDICKGINIKNDFDYIYHLAANTDARFPDDVEMYRNNILSFLEVLKFALKGKGKLIYTSSASVYGCKNNNIINAYAHSKRLVDEIAERFSSRLKIVGLRPFNVYGEGELGKGKNASVITQWREQILKGERPTIFSGDYKRDFIYVKDVVKGLKKAMKLKNGIYDLGTGIATDFFDVFKIVTKVMDVYIEPSVIKNPYIGTYQEYTKANIKWGFKPDYTVESGIKDYFKDERK